jgi:hypothetical protein
MQDKLQHKVSKRKNGYNKMNVRANETRTKKIKKKKKKKKTKEEGRKGTNGINK